MEFEKQGTFFYDQRDTSSYLFLCQEKVLRFLPSLYRERTDSKNIYYYICLLKRKTKYQENSWIEFFYFFIIST